MLTQVFEQELGALQRGRVGAETSAKRPRKVQIVVGTNGGIIIQIGNDLLPIS